MASPRGLMSREAMCIVDEISLIGWSLQAGERGGVHRDEHQPAASVNRSVWRSQISDLAADPPTGTRAGSLRRASRLDEYPPLFPMSLLLVSALLQ
jgi:hypothetical protein